MTSPDTPSTPGVIRRLWQKRWARIVFFTVVAISLFLLLLPFGVKYGLQRWLLANGADNAVISKLWINPFTRRVTLQGVNVTVNGKTVLAESNVQLDIGLLALLDSEANIQKASFTDTVLDIEQYEDGRWRIGSFTTRGTDEDALEEVKEADPFFFRVNDLSLSNFTLRYKQPDYQAELVLDKAELKTFTTRPDDKTGTLMVQGRLNNAPIELHLDTLRTAPNLKITGTLNTSNIHLDDLEKILHEYLKPFSGIIAAQGRIDFTLQPNSDMKVEYEGTVDLNEGNVAGPSWATTGKTLAWDGTVGYQASQQSGMIVDVDGSLHGAELDLNLPEIGLALKDPDLAVKGNTTITIADSVTVQSDATLTSKALDFSLPPFSLQDSGMQWQGTAFYTTGAAKEGQTVKANGSLTWQQPLVKSTAEDMPLDAGVKDLSWNGLVEYKGVTDATAASAITINGKLGANALALNLPQQLQFHQAELLLQGKSAMTLGTDIDINFDGNLNLRGTDLKTEEMVTQSHTLDWSGKAGFLATEKQSAIKLDGKLQGKTLAAVLAGSSLKFDQEALAITAKGEINFGDAVTLQGKSSFSADNFRIIDQKNNENLLSLDHVKVADIDAPGGRKISVKSADADGLNIAISGNIPLSVTVPEINLENLNTDDLATITADSLSVQSPVVRSRKNNKELARLNSMIIEQLQASTGMKVSAREVLFDEFFFLSPDEKERKNSVCTLGSARLAGITWTPDQGLGGRSLTFSDLSLNIFREKDGALALNRQLQAMRTQSSEAAVEETKVESGRKNAAAGLQIETITVHGNSGLYFEDHTLAVPFTSNLAIKTLQVTNLNSGTPDTPAKMRLDATFEKRAPLDVKGTIAPFGKDLALSMKVKLKNYPLTRLSPYTVQSVGVGLASGQLELESNINISDNELDMQNELLLQKLETSTISKELADKLDNELPIPLDSALSVLRDKDDNISLDVPINGPLAELNVGITDILITALGKAIVPAASGYLMYTLGPYGALAWVGMKVGEKMLQIQLPPVEFMPGENEIPENLKDYFERLAKILHDKPEADFQLCPQSSAWEFISESKKEKLEEKELKLRDRDKKKLMKLGQERAQNIKDYLIRNYSIDKDRLLICITGIETEKSAKPRVDIQM
ncbi:MAG: DUF748 domain-containing protein [Desulfobulbaceae bacterium]|nr:DUF748 domain-containing protein [Desulfobulbaceae bacterium]